ncbi:MAG: hypothetical protein ACRDQA_15725 [Nocardioidaceae bacterium]
MILTACDVWDFARPVPKPVPDELILAAIRPKKLATVDQVIVSTIQSAYYEQDEGALWVTQGDYYADNAPVQSTYVIRCDANGTELDHMFCYGGGHGANFGIQRIGGVPHVWLMWDHAIDESKVFEIVRFPYAAGTTIDRTNAGIESFDKGVAATQRVQFGIDVDGDRMVQRLYWGGLRYRLRRLSDVVGGVDDMLAEIVAPVPHPEGDWFQGVATTGDHAYVCQGIIANNVAAPEPAAVGVYTWSAGTFDMLADADQIGRSPDGTFWGGRKKEPEGITISRSASTGMHFASVGVSLMDDNGNYRHEVWVYDQADTIV